MMRWHLEMSSMRKKTLARWIAISATAWTVLAAPLHSQVNPAEISNPRLRAAQTTYFAPIKALYTQINKAKFPYPFALTRYAGIDPARQREADARGIEFVFFHGRMILKASGRYDAAFRSDFLSQNQRAGRTFSEVIEPLVSLTSETIPADLECDGIGFEVSFHVRTRNHNFDFEGKEIIAVVFEPADLFAFARASSDSERQEILNRSEVYLDGNRFGLALGATDSLDLDALESPSVPKTKLTPAIAATTTIFHPDTTPVRPAVLIPGMRQDEQAGVHVIQPFGMAPIQPGRVNMPGTPPDSAEAPRAPANAADVDKVQLEFQGQLDTLAKLGAARFHFVDYAPPSFVIYRNEIILQWTVRNTTSFSPESTSLYKRAAQTFDLFLAGQLKQILEKIPVDAPFAGYDITVLNQFNAGAQPSSEAIEFICPRGALQRFVDADITNQQLIDQSVVLVNGVRIALNLQLVE